MSFSSAALSLLFLLFSSTTFLATAADQYEYDFFNTSTCPADGYSSIANAQECSDAAAATSHDFMGITTSPYIPSGCVFNSKGEQVLLWNADKTGEAHEKFSPVCKGKLLRTWSYSDCDCVD